MNRYRSLLRTPEVEIGRFDHPRQPHHDPDQETAGSLTINFLETGSFGLHTCAGNWRLSPGDVFVTRPGMVYRCSHEQAVPSDGCLTVAFRRRFADDLPPRSAASPLPPVLARSNRLAYVRHRLLSLLNAASGEMGAEVTALDLLDAVQGYQASARIYREQQLQWYADRIDGVRNLLEQTYAEPHTLSGLARSAGVSAFHFARLFRELTGSPPHRYLTRVRLRHARERLRDGLSVTETCFAVGFQNLGQFIRMFRRAHGVSPSRYAASAGN